MFFFALDVPPLFFSVKADPVLTLFSKKLPSSVSLPD